MVGLVHVLRALQPEHRQVGEQHPVQEAGVVNADPCHQAEGQPEALPEGVRSRNPRAHQQDAGKEQHAKALGQQHILGSIAHVHPLVGLEVCLLDVRRVVVYARGAVFPVAAIIGKDDHRKDRRKGRHFGQNDPGIHAHFSFLYVLRISSQEGIWRYSRSKAGIGSSGFCARSR